MDENKFIESVKHSALKDVEYFSNSNKAERERWVVHEFLSILNFSHHKDELCSPEQESKIDVCFRDAKFQVKELTDPDLRRGDLNKKIYKSAENATSLKDLSLVGKASDVPPVSNMYDLVHQFAHDLAKSKKYKATKHCLDLLIYVTRTRSSLIKESEISKEMLSNLGWRSISCVNTKQAIVLYTSESAPDFLVQRSEKIINTKR